MKKTYLLKIHGISGSVVDDPSSLCVFDGELPTSERERLIAVVEGPRFDQGLFLCVAAEDDDTDMDSINWFAQNIRKPPRGNTSLAEFIEKRLGGSSDLNDFAMCSWMKLKAEEVRLEILHQLKLSRRLPDLDAEGRVRVDLYHLNNWFLDLNMKSLTFGFVVGDAGMVGISMIQPHRDVPALNERLSMFVPGLLIAAGLPFTSGATGEIRLADTSTRITAAHPETGWIHDRSVGLCLDLKHGDIGFGKSPPEGSGNAADAARALGELLGDVDHEASVTCWVRNGAMITDPEITLSGRDRHETPEMSHRHKATLSSAIRDFLPACIASAHEVLLQQDDDDNRMSRFHSYYRILISEDELEVSATPDIQGARTHKVSLDDMVQSLERTGAAEPDLSRMPEP